MAASRGLLLRYGVPVAVTVASTLLSFPLARVLDAGVLLLYVPAVMIAAWVGGLGPGLLATVLGVILSTYFFLDPRYTFTVRSAADLAQLVVFSFVAFFISLLHTAQKRAQGALVDSREKLSLVFDITRAANDSETLDQAFGFAIRRICEGGRWVYAHLYLPERESADTLVPSIYFHTTDRQRWREFRANSLSRPLVRGDGAAGRSLASGNVEWGPAEEPFRSAAAFPVRIGQETIGVIEVYSTELLPRDETLVPLMGVVGLELGRVVERQRLQENYSEAVWEQQRVIAQELHDGLGQELTGLGFISRSLEGLMKGGEESKRAARLTEGLQHALEQIRGLARGVSPVAPETEGLMTALAQLAESVSAATGVRCVFECAGNVFVDQNPIAVHLYRIAQEAVTNAAKHGKPSRIAISLSRSPAGLELSVTDDGRGLKAAPARSAGSGLRIMRYRANAIGASLSIDDAAGSGTKVTCILADNAGRLTPKEISA